MNIKNIALVVSYADHFTRDWMTLEQKVRVVQTALTKCYEFYPPEKLDTKPEDIWRWLGINEPARIG